MPTLWAVFHGHHDDSQSLGPDLRPEVYLLVRVWYCSQLVRMVGEPLSFPQEVLWLTGCVCVHALKCVDLVACLRFDSSQQIQTDGDKPGQSKADDEGKNTRHRAISRSRAASPREAGENQ